MMLDHHPGDTAAEGRLRNVRWNCADLQAEAHTNRALIRVMQRNVEDAWFDLVREAGYLENDDRLAEARRRYDFANINLQNYRRQARKLVDNCFKMRLQRIQAKQQAASRWADAETAMGEYIASAFRF